MALVLMDRISPVSTREKYEGVRRTGWKERNELKSRHKNQKEISLFGFVKDNKAMVPKVSLVATDIIIQHHNLRSPTDAISFYAK